VSGNFASNLLGVIHRQCMPRANNYVTSNNKMSYMNPFNSRTWYPISGLTIHSPSRVGSALFHPISGGMLMRADRLQTMAIIMAMRVGDLFMAYWKGRVMTKYRSILMAHRFNIDDVQSSTSSEVHASQIVLPSTHVPITCVTCR